MRPLHILLCVLFLSNVALASGEGAAAGHGETKEGEKKKEEKVEKISTTQQEILDLQAKLQGLKTKIAAKKENVKKLVADKDHTHDKDHALHIVEQLKTEYKEYTAAIQEYEEQRSLLNYRYPEKGRSADRKYERIEVKSLDEMENEFSIEGKVKKALVRIRQQYPSTQAANKEKKAQVDSKPKQEHGLHSQPHDSSRSSVTESQILSK